MKKFRGFTLAEVLIVITIIGVVAVLTLPMLIENIDDRIMESQNKKAKAVLASGIKMLTAQNGSPYLKDTRLKRCGENSECIAAEMKKVFKITDDSITSPDAFRTSYLQNEDSENEFNAWDPREGINYAFLTADGAIYGIYDNASDRESLTVAFDANGTKNPNIGESDLCIAQFDETAQLITDGKTCSMNMNQNNKCDYNNLDACDQSSCNALVSSTAGCSYQYYYTLCRQGDPNCKPGVCRQVCKGSK